MAGRSNVQQMQSGCVEVTTGPSLGIVEQGWLERSLSAAWGLATVTGQRRRNTSGLGR